MTNYRARAGELEHFRLYEAINSFQLSVFVANKDNQDLMKLANNLAADRFSNWFFQSDSADLHQFQGRPLLFRQAEFERWLEQESDKQAEEQSTNRAAFENSYWPAIMCLAWIGTRDSDFTGLTRLDETGLRLAIRLAMRSAEKLGPEGRCIEWSIERELLAAIQSGRLEGIGSLDASRVPIDAAVACLPDARFVEDKWGQMILEAGKSTYCDLLFPREAALALWPPLSLLPAEGPPDQTVKTADRIAGRYSYRPPIQRQKAIDALRGLYGTTELPPMKWAARLADVNGYLVQKGDTEISLDTLKRAAKTLQAKG